MTIKEIAKLAGVSPSTVSKIMNGKDTSISPETRNHVLKIAKEYHYKPYASILKTTTSKTLCLGVIFRSNCSASLFMQGILNAAHTNGYTVIFQNSYLSIENEYKNISTLLAQHVDGILWEPVSEDYSTSEKQISNAKIPYFLFNCASKQSKNIDFQQLGYQSTKSLIDCGHTAISCLIPNNYHATSFLTGYKQCLFDHNLTFLNDFIFEEKVGIPATKLSSHTFSAILTYHYQSALQLIKTLATLHYTVPHDFSIITLKTEEQSLYDFPDISGYMIPHDTFSYQLTTQLIYSIEQKKPLIPIQISFQLDHSHSIQTPYYLRNKKVLSIGSINIDNYLNFKHLPHTGKTVTAPTSVTHPGGKCVNEAVGVSKFGHNTCAIGCVGDDAQADSLYNYLNGHNIDTSGIQRCKNLKTGQAYIFVQEDGNSMISIMSGANNFVSKEYIQQCEHLFINSSFCLLQTEIPIDSLTQAALLAQKHHVKTVLKPSACSELPYDLLKHIHILVPNLNELNEICPQSISMEEKVQLLHSKGVETVIVTLGNQGCYLSSDNLTVRIPAIDVVSVDSSGAGDAFISALISYLLYGYSLYDSSKIATYAAGLSTTRQGTTSALIDKNTLESYIRRYEPDLLK